LQTVYILFNVPFSTSLFRFSH